MADGNDSDQEKTLDPSARRLEQAREEGQIARSRELSAALSTFACVLVLYYLGGDMVRAVGGWLNHAFTEAGRQAARPHETAPLLDQTIVLLQDGLWLLFPFLLATVVAGVAGSVGLGGFLFTGKALMPKFQRLDPIQGLGRLFSLYGLAELGKSVLKVLLLGGLATWLAWRAKEQWIGLLLSPQPQALRDLAGILAVDMLILAGALFLIAAVDVPIQWWNHHKQLRMSFEEMKRENKESEGDPMVKGRIRQLQRERARARMMQAVPTADVVVTNPTHYAVALKYEEGRMQAPRVVAKGVDAVAARIRELADEHGVQRVESPALARALYRHVEIEDEVPGPLFKAVAQVLAYVYQLKAYRQGPAPVFQEPSVPPGWDPYAPEALSRKAARHEAIHGEPA